MGYFPNASAAEFWEVENCEKCIHGGQGTLDTECAVHLAHLLHNYEECNNEKSILHLLIPLSEDGLGNQQCKMFIDESKIQVLDE